MTPRKRETGADAPVPPWPVLEIVLDAHGGGTVNGRSVSARDVDSARDEMLAEASRYAAVLGRPLRVRAIDPNGVWHLVAHPDGAVTALPDELVIDLRDRPAPTGDDEVDRYLAQNPADDVAPLPDDDAEPGGTWHLRVHPNGAITPVEDDDAPPRPAARPATPPVAPPRQEPHRVIDLTSGREGWTPPRRPEPETAVPVEAPVPVEAAVPVPPPAPVPVPTDEVPAPGTPVTPPADEVPAPADEVEAEAEGDPAADTLETAVDTLETEVPDLETGAVEEEPEAETEAATHVESTDEAESTDETEDEPEPDTEATRAFSATEPPRADAGPEPDDVEPDALEPDVPLGPVRRPAPAPGGWYQPTPSERERESVPEASDPAEPTELPSAPFRRTVTGGGEVPVPDPFARPAPPSPQPDVAPETLATPQTGRATPRTFDTTAEADDEQLPWAAASGGQRSTVRSEDLIDDLRAANAEPSTGTGPTRRWVRPAMIAGAAAVVLGALYLVGNLSSSPSPTATGPRPTVTQTAHVTPGGTGAGVVAGPASAPPTLASPPANLAIAPPPGFRAKPVWGLPVKAGATPVVTPGGQIFTITADHQLAMIDPADGTVLWHTVAPDQATGPHLGVLDGARTVALTTPQELFYWPLDAKGAPAATQPARVALPGGATVSWSGPSPLVTQSDGTVGVVRNGAVQRVNLPAGTKALAADGADVLGVAGRNWIRQAAGQGPAAPQSLAAPDSATGETPIKVDNVGGAFLAGMWAGPEGPIVAVYDAHSGALAVQTTFPKGTDFARSSTVRQAGSDRTAVGTALVDPTTQNFTILSPSFTPVALAPGHVYANDVSGVVVDLQIKGSSIKIVPFTGKNPTVPVGLITARNRQLAVVVAPAGAGWLLAALPTT